MLITIYRIEHPSNGEGPYRRQWVRDIDAPLNEMGWEHNGESWPTPSDDFGDEREEWHLFGFKSKELLRTWFRGWMLDIKNLGFKIAEVQIPTSFVLEGKSGKQVMFDSTEVVTSNYLEI